MSFNYFNHLFASDNFHVFNWILANALIEHHLRQSSWSIQFWHLTFLHCISIRRYWGLNWDQPNGSLEADVLPSPATRLTRSVRRDYWGMRWNGRRERRCNRFQMEQVWGMTDREKVQQIGSIPKENAFPGSKSQRSVSCVNTFREFLTPGIPVHLMVTQATIWGFSGGQTQYFNPLQRRALVRLFWAKQQYLLA